MRTGSIVTLKDIPPDSPFAHLNGRQAEVIGHGRFFGTDENGFPAEAIGYAVLVQGIARPMVFEPEFFGPRDSWAADKVMRLFTMEG